MSKKRLHELKELLRYYDSLYYGRNISAISDYEYDRLKREYKSLGGEDFVGSASVDLNSEWQLSNGAEYRAISDRKTNSEKRRDFKNDFKGDFKNKFQRSKVDHVASVLSLDNVYSFEELQQFVKRVQKSIESKTECAHESKLENIENLENLESLEKKSPSYGADIRNSEISQDDVCNSDFYSFFVQEKIDGLTLVLKYESGKLISAATRGDGNVGDSVNVQHVFGVVTELVSEFIDEELLKNKVIEIRGEVFMKRSDFLDLNKSLSKSLNESEANSEAELVSESLCENPNMHENRKMDDSSKIHDTPKTEKTFSTPRHAASGSLKNLDMNLVHNRKLYFVAHGVALNDDFLNLMHELKCDLVHRFNHEVNGSLSDFLSKVVDADSKSENNSKSTHNLTYDLTHNLTFDFIMNLLSLWKFPTIEGHVCHSLHEMQSAYEAILSRRSKIDYDIDGVVYKLNDLVLQEKVGYSNSSPKFAIAYKFPPSAVQSVVKNISFSVGRTGLVTPVAHVKRVYLDGVYISNVSLHNFSELTRKDIEVGDVVTIERAGDVIPYIREVVKKKNAKKSDSCVLPDFCPSCASTLVSKGILYYCLNNKCRDQVILRLLYFADVLGIMGLGRKNIEFFYEKNFIREFIDIFTLNSYKQEMELSDNWGAISVDKLLNEIDKARNVRFDVFLKSLGIPGVGDFVSKSIAKHFKTLQNLLNLISLDSLEEFLELCKNIFGVGEKTAVELYDYLKRYLNTIVMLTKVMNILPYSSANSVSNSGSNFNARNANDALEDEKSDAIEDERGSTRGNYVIGDDMIGTADTSVLDSRNALSGKNAFSKELSQKEIVLTGRFIDISRKDLEKIIDANDGVVKKEVSKKTHLVVFGENPTQRKINAAENGKISTMHVSEFLNLLNSIE